MFSPLYPPVDFRSQEHHTLHESLIFLSVHQKTTGFLMFKCRKQRYTLSNRKNGNMIQYECISQFEDGNYQEDPKIRMETGVPE